MKNELLQLEMKKQALHKQIIKIEKQINELKKGELSND